MELVGKHNCFGTSYLSLFLLGAILLFFRSAYSFTTPYLFAEDGIWFSELINDGFIHTFFNQRYFMTGYLLLEEIAIGINKLLFGYNLRYFAEIVAVVSYSFHSIVALMTFICLRRNLRAFPRYLIWFLILMLPMGGTGVEMFGRILNFGYMFYFIALILIFYLIFNAKANTSKVKQILIFATLWVCSTTNSASNLILAVGFFTDITLQFLYIRKKQANHPDVFFYLKALFGKFKNLMWLGLGIICSICFIYQALAMQLISDGSIPHILKHENIIEFFGREILFYFTWPFYRYLNNNYVILMLCLFFLFIVFAIVVTKKEKRLEVIYLAVGTLLIAMATFAMRPGLTSFLHNYQSTFPDRYYYVINICAMVSIIYAVSCFEGCMTLKFCKIYVYLLLALPFALAPSSIFEFNKSSYIEPFPFTSFSYGIFTAERQPNGLYKVMTSPPSLPTLSTIYLPENYVCSTVINERDYRTVENSKKFYALLNNDILHIVYDGDEDSVWLAIWSNYNGQDDLVWVKTSTTDCMSGRLCYNMALSAAQLLESPYYVHFYKGKNKPETILGALSTPMR